MYRLEEFLLESFVGSIETLPFHLQRPECNCEPWFLPRECRMPCRQQHSMSIPHRQCKTPAASSSPHPCCACASSRSPLPACLAQRERCAQPSRRPSWQVESDSSRTFRRSGPAVTARSLRESAHSQKPPSLRQRHARHR